MILEAVFFAKTSILFKQSEILRRVYIYITQSENDPDFQASALWWKQSFLSVSLQAKQNISLRTVLLQLLHWFSGVTYFCWFTSRVIYFTCPSPQSFHLAKHACIRLAFLNIPPQKQLDVALTLNTTPIITWIYSRKQRNVYLISAKQSAENGYYMCQSLLCTVQKTIPSLDL